MNYSLDRRGHKQIRSLATCQKNAMTDIRIHIVILKSLKSEADISVYLRGVKGRTTQPFQWVQAAG